MCCDRERIFIGSSQSCLMPIITKQIYNDSSSNDNDNKKKTNQSHIINNSNKTPRLKMVDPSHSQLGEQRRQKNETEPISAFVKYE